MTDGTDLWPRKAVGDVFDFLPSRAIKLSGSAAVRAVTSACLTETGFTEDGVKDALMDSSDVADAIIEPGEILIARSNTPELVGRAAVFEGSEQTLVASDLTIRLRCLGDLSPNFAGLWFSYLFSTGYWRERASGASDTMKKIGRAQLSGTTIPIPSIAIQRSMASRLNERMTAVVRARLSIETIRKSFDELVATWVQDGLQKAETITKPVDKVLKEVTQGIGDRWTEFPVLGATRNGVAPAKERVGKAPGRYKPVLPGDVFYNPMRIVIGSIAMVDDGEAPGITSPDYVVVRPKGADVHPVWCYEWLRSRHGERFIQTLARGGVRERMLFNRLKAGQMPIPPYAWQQRFAQVARLRRQAVKLLTAQLDTLEALPGAYLREAFGGLSFDAEKPAPVHSTP